jgi:ADP-heptose:LPS heptosyltransferase
MPPAVSERLSDRGRDLRILVIRFGAMGDVVRTLPAVRLLRAALPRAELSWAVDDTWRALLDGHADLDRVVAIARSRLKPDVSRPWRWPRLVSAILDSVSRIRDPEPLLVLDFHGNLLSGVTGRMSRAPVRIGYAGHQQREGNRCFNTHHVPAGARRVSRIERNLSLVRFLGLPCEPLPSAGLEFEPAVRERARTIVGQAFGREGPYAVLSPGASRRQAYKRPPGALLTAAVRALARAGVPTLVVYGPGEEQDAARLAAAEPESARLAPPTDLRVLGALIGRARAFVGGDSGPMHLACGMGTPVVAIYGPTDPVVNGPWGVPHRAVCPPASYSGFKRRDRRTGRFEDVPQRAVEEAVGDLIAATADGVSRR